MDRTEGKSGDAGRWLAMALSLLLILQALLSAGWSMASAAENDPLGPVWICTENGLVPLDEEDGGGAPHDHHIACACCKLSSCGGTVFLPQKAGIALRYGRPVPIRASRFLACPPKGAFFARIHQARAPPVAAA
ncbi:MAG: DUF2946 family protein [Geminicoccaceae bacterium]